MQVFGYQYVFQVTLCDYHVWLRGQGVGISASEKVTYQNSFSRRFCLCYQIFSILQNGRHNNKKKLHLSQKRLEIEWKGRNFGGSHIYCQWWLHNLFEHFKNLENLRKHEFALIPETVRDRGKLMKFWDHKNCQWPA